MMITLSVVDTVNLQDKQHKIKLPAHFWSWKRNWNKTLFVLFSNVFLMFLRTPSNCSCWENQKPLSLLPVTLPDILKETHKPQLHHWGSSEFSHNFSKIYNRKHFPFKESDFQCCLASIVYPGPSLVFPLISSVFLFARNHPDLNCNGQKCNLQDKLGQNNIEEILKVGYKLGCPGKHRKDWAYLRFPLHSSWDSLGTLEATSWSGNVLVAGTPWQDSRTETSPRQQNGAGQDFQLMEKCMKQRQHKVAAADFSPALLSL